MSRELLWTPDVVDWQNVSVESYQFVIEQAKERLDEVINESRLVTASGMKVLLVYVTALPGLAGYIFSEHKNFSRDLITIILVTIVAAFAIYIFTLLISLIAPGRLFFKGSEPKDIFKAETFIKLDSQAGFKNLLFIEIQRIQDKIERIQTNNKKRINHYKSVLRVSLILVAVLVFALVKLIFTGP
jgi:hypothetical protein